MKRFLLFCSGADTGALKERPADESRHAGIGANVLLTSILAACSGAYALFTVFRSVTAAVLLGLFWGVVIFNLDRLIVSGMRKQKHAWIDLLFATPRLVLAVLLAIVISRPLELRLFQGEIQERRARMQIDAHGRDLERIFAGDSARLARLQGENARLEQEVAAARAEFNVAEEAWIQEKEGTAGTGIPGAGPVLQEKQRAREEAWHRLDEVEARNRPLRARNDTLIAQIVAEQNRRIRESDSVRSEADGFLARMEAFGSLKRESRTIQLASLFITLLFIALQTAPVMVTLSTRGPYRLSSELTTRFGGMP